MVKDNHDLKQDPDYILPAECDADNKAPTECLIWYPLVLCYALCYSFFMDSCFLLLTAIIFAIKDYGILNLLDQICHLNCG